MSTRAQLSETLNRLLPGERWKRVREGILAAASYSGQRTDQLRQNIDEANRLKTGLLVKGTVEFTSTTNADVSGFAWVVDFVIRQQSGTESITVDAPDADFPRPDIFVGLADGSVVYRAGTVDEEGNVQEPSYNPATEVLLASFTRNPDNSNDEGANEAGGSDFVSKSATGTEVMQGSLAIGALSDPDNPSNLIQVDSNGKIIIVRADRIGSFATRNLAVGFSRLARINTVVSGGPAIRDYQFKLDILATLDGDVTQRGELYCALINDGTGTYVSSVLEVTGDLNPDVFKLVKVSATEYDLFYEHLDTKAILIYRPFALGPADRYIFYRRETILASLPAGDQYEFTAFGGGTELDANIVDALEAANLPDVANPFATIDDIPIVPEDFIDLLDVPSGYTGQAGKKVKVKADETGLEFVDDTGGGGADANAVHYNADDSKTASEKQRARDNIGLNSGIEQVISTDANLGQITRTSNLIVLTGATVNRLIDGLSEGIQGEICTIRNRSASTYQLRNLITPPSNGMFDLSGITLYTLLANRDITLTYDSSLMKWVFFDKTPIVYGRKDTQDTWSSGAIMEGTGNNLATQAPVIIKITTVSTIASVLIFRDASNNRIGYFTSGGRLVLEANRSNAANEAIRRDEKRIYNQQNITTPGTINNQALDLRFSTFRFTAASSITGFGNGEIGRTIDIDNATGGVLTLPHENAGSIAANRNKLIGGTDLNIPIDGKVSIKYCTGNRWELVSKNF